LNAKTNRKAEPAGRVLSVASECAPLVKTGGLADVAGALPQALAGEGWQVKTLLPAYPGLIERLLSPSVLWESGDIFGREARILAGALEKGASAPQFLLLDMPEFFHREGSIYLGPDGTDWPDNALRFAALSWVAADIARAGLADGWRPGVVHAHDWQAGFAPTYLRQFGVEDVGTVMTIHNIAFQGLAPATMLGALRLAPSRFNTDGFEYWGQISALKAGMMDADVITTVSPTYMDELATPEFGMGLDGVIRLRHDHVVGILNGVDPKVWNPRKDPLIAQCYGPRTLDEKRHNTDALAAEFGLEAGDGPLFGIVSRLTWQKGVDLLLEALPALLDEGARLVVLGSGEAHIEAALGNAAQQNPSRIGVRIGYDEALSHRIFAGAESILVPSRFEPCGLTQLYALRYGAPPIVAHTGGLADTVIDANDAAVRAGVATGKQFAPPTAAALIGAIRALCALYRQPSLWRRMQERAMKHPVGWVESAQAYRSLYERILK